MMHRSCAVTGVCEPFLTRQVDPEIRRNEHLVENNIMDQNDYTDSY